MTNQAAMRTFIQETGGWVASQVEACTRCAMCSEACHFYQATGEREYMPVWKFELLRRAYEQRFTALGQVLQGLHLSRPITDKDLEHWSRIIYYACTLCNKCAMVCPMGIQIGPLIHDMRSAMSEAGVVPADLMAAVNKQMEEGSPLGVTESVFDDRLDWVADEWDAELPKDVHGADTLVVFSSIEIMKYPTNLAAIAKILNTAGEKWTVSTKGREVVNFAFYEGNHARTVQLMHRVFDAAQELGVKRILVTECGHAYDALRWTAPNMMEVPKGIEVMHIAGLLGDYVRSGRIKIKPGFFDDDGIITFHDACKIQRRGGHIHEPREILKILAPKAFVEMVPNKEQAICCGGGGGVISIKEADPLRYAVFELKMAQMNKIGAKTVTMSCSNCRLQYDDSVKHFEYPVKVTGLSQMVADALVD